MESLERKEKAGEGMNEFVDRYIYLYFNKSITKCVANAIQTSRLRLFLGDYCTGLQTRLADAINSFIGEKLC